MQKSDTKQYGMRTNIRLHEYLTLNGSYLKSFMSQIDLFGLRNFLSLMLFRLNVLHRTTIRLDKSKSITLSKKEDYSEFWTNREVLSAQIKKDHLPIKIGRNVATYGQRNKVRFYFDSDMQMQNAVGLMVEQFFKGQYAWLNVKARTVLDIGANVGDTAIYFAQKGATHVYAYEPWPYSYMIAKKNVELNRLGSKITLVNEACGGERGNIRTDPLFKNSGDVILKRGGKGTLIKIVKLEDIAKKYGLDNCMLKMDCEGYEYGIILNEDASVLRKFEQIVIEYHYGYKNLETKLKECGFKVRHTAPQFYYGSNSSTKEYVGLLFAERTPYAK